jgi:hypothetical protein
MRQRLEDIGENAIGERGMFWGGIVIGCKVRHYLMKHNFDFERERNLKQMPEIVSKIHLGRCVPLDFLTIANYL